MPEALLFMSNVADASVLANERGRDVIAAGVASAMRVGVAVSARCRLLAMEPG